MPVRDMLPDYLSYLAPTSYDRGTVATRKDKIEAALRRGGIDVVGMVETGSFSHGTSIKNRADVDLMVWVDIVQKPVLPSSALDRFKTELGNRLWIWSANVSSPTVRVVFWSAPHFEVTPAFYAHRVDGIIVYDIAGRRDEWIRSAPSAHNALVNGENRRLGGNVKPLIRLVKAWKYHVKAPISSFYLEMRVTEYASSKASIAYNTDLPQVLRGIVTKDVADMNDPGRIVGRIPACSSDDKQREARSLVQSAVESLEEAERHRLAGNKLRYWWAMREVFGLDFPYPTS